MSINRPPKPQAWVPLALGLALCLGAYLGRGLGGSEEPWSIGTALDVPSGQVLTSVLDRIDKMYVDPVNRGRLTEVAIEAILDELDPHSDWFSAEELAAMAEPMEGNFEGIGVEFLLQEDTIMVVTPIPGGPSSEAGVMSGDRIVAVDDSVIAGTGLTNSKVMKLLKGPAGTEVRLGLMRPGSPDSGRVEVALNRGRIPIHSVVAAERMPGNIGYLKVIRFARNTHKEFDLALSTLLDQGVDRFVLDLRGNGGGYLHAAVPMVETFLDEGDLVVYTEGAAQPRREYITERPGRFREQPLVVLVDEGSASASEILAGALQDQDRAVVVGRRTFGKGLVQEEFPVADRGALRLTVARYYTPSGRSIQRPYGEGIDYEEEWMAREERGEYVEADSVMVVDSLAYTTEAGRLVFGGGGIAPDVFVPLDTLGYPASFRELVYAGSLREHAFRFGTDNRSSLLSLGSVDAFMGAVEAGLNLDVEGLINATFLPNEDRERSLLLSRRRVAERIAHNLWGESAGHRAVLRTDPGYAAAVSAMERVDRILSVDLSGARAHPKPDSETGPDTYFDRSN